MIAIAALICAVVSIAISIICILKK